MLGQVLTGELGPILATLSVLYEDLRLETYGLTTDELPALDQLTAGYRRVYFVRRASVTLLEFSKAPSRLNRHAEFKKFKRVSQDQWRDWDQMMSEFSALQTPIKAVRDATGGHFLTKTAELAITRAGSKVASLEVSWQTSQGANARLFFAGEIAAYGAVGSIASENRSEEEQVDQLVNLSCRDTP